MAHPRYWTALALLAGTLALYTSPARAVPYASGVRNTGGATWEFVLNEAADNVTVLRNGGNALNLGALAPGRHTFDMTGFATFDIEVSNAAATGWTSISDLANPFANFTLPTGVAINANPASPYFGTVYVANGDPVATQAGRTMGDGVYALTADMKGVDLANNFAVVTDPNDATQAKAPGWTVGGSTASPWRMALDAAGNLIVSDWSDPNGGIKYASPNLTTGGLVLAIEGDATLTNHGSIASKPYVTGSIGNNLIVEAMDEDLPPFNTIWRWNVGNATAYDQFPTAVIDSFALDVQSSWISTVNGVRAGAHYSPQHDLWYLVQNRSDGNQAGIFVVEADDMDGLSPMPLWDSLTWTQDPNGDLDPADALDGHTGLDGNQDVFRNIGDVTMSADGTKLIVHRIAARGAANPHVPGAVMIIPLDANGVPDIDVSGGMITNVETITTQGNDLAHSSGAQLEFDAAGNLYVANSGLSTATPSLTGQLVQVFSPGGNTKAVTKSDGTFSVLPFVPPAENADFDGDGDVDGADFLTWQKNLGISDGSANLASGDANDDGNVTGADLAIWQAQFDQAPPAAAVPEPATAAQAALGLLAMAGGARRRRR